MTRLPAQADPTHCDAPATQPARPQASSLLDRQRHALELIVRGEPLAVVLSTLCLTVEAEAEDQVVASIHLVENGRLVRGAEPGLPEDYSAAIDGLVVSADVGTCSAAAALGQRVVTEDIANDPHWAEFAHWPLGLGLLAAWSMPITGADGQVVATMGTYFRTRRGPTPSELDLVTTLARTAALAIERSRSDEQLRLREARHEFLARLSAALQTLSEPDAVVATAARMLGEHLGADRCIYAVLREPDQLEVVGGYARVADPVTGLWPVTAFGTAFEATVRAGRSHLVADSDQDLDISPRIRTAFEATGIRAAISVPLLRDGRLTALMAVCQATPRRWKAHEVAVCEQLVLRCWEAMERARVTSALRDSESRYRAMVQASPECVKLVAPDGTLLQMNDAGLRMIEAEEPDAAVGQCVYKLIAPGFRDAFRLFNERVCRGEGGTLGFEVVGLKGTRRWMETTAVALPWRDGGFAQLAVTRDVSARVMGERALADSRARLDYAVRLSGIGFWYCDLPFEELMWEPRVKAHFFLPPDARVTIDRFYERIHPDDREPTRQAIEHSIEGHTAYDVYYRTTDPHSAAFKWIRALGGTTYAEDGSPLRFDGVTVDVTQVKLNEDRLAELLERERAQARLLSEVAQAARTIYASTSVDSVIKVLTEEARRIIGAHHSMASLHAGSAHLATVTSVSVSDKYLAETLYHPLATEPAVEAELCGANQALRLNPAELAAYPQWWQRAARVGHPALRGWLAAPLVKQDGTNFGVIELSDPVADAFGEVDEAILVQLAQIGSVALQNSRLYEALREQDSRKNEFIATLAHELRNPLAPIRSGLPILAKGAEPALAQRTAKMMDRQITHLVRLVDDLLDVSRITHGKVVLSRRSCSLHELIESAVDTAMPQVEAFGHALHVDWPDESVLVDGDPTRLSQVLSNLINNAAKYTPKGGRLHVAAAAEAEQVVVHVQDNGLGIPAPMLDRIFELFTQVERAEQAPQPGLGIGLTLVRRLVEMHGGSVSAQSAGPGMGSRFTVRLPRLAHAPTSAAPGARLPVPEQVGRRVLVVDDNRDAAEMLQALLEMEGHVVCLAYDGHEAVRAAAAFAPQVAFIDIGLPGLNGFEVAQRLRGSSPVARLYALTGWGTDDYRERGREAGFEDHLVKPVDPDRLLQLLAQAVSG